MAAGKSLGTAPDADLYYVGSSNINPQINAWNEKYHYDFTKEAHALLRILEINKGLPRNRKIRVLSDSSIWDPTHNGYQEMNDALEEAESQGIFVISANLFATSRQKFIFYGLDRDPLDDPDKSSYYKPDFRH